MTNRIQHLFDERAESPRSGEYFVVTGEFGQVFVARETARRLRTLIARFLQPRWLTFSTITGSLMVVRSRHVYTIVESTLEQRAESRRFWREREKEEEEENNQRPW